MWAKKDKAARDGQKYYSKVNGNENKPGPALDRPFKGQKEQIR